MRLNEIKGARTENWHSPTFKNQDKEKEPGKESHSGRRKTQRVWYLGVD